MTDTINNSSNSKGIPPVMTAIDIAKKFHDALIQWPSGKKKVLKIGNHLKGYQGLLDAASCPPEQIEVAFEPTADYHRNIASSNVVVCRDAAY